MKHLNKFLFVIAAFCTTGLVMAQEQVKTINHNFKSASPELTLEDLNNDKLSKADYTGWFSPVDAADAPGTGNFTSFVSFLVPDSTVKFVSSDGTDFFYNWHSLGMVVDLTDENFELVDDGIRQARWDSIDIDSVAFNYLYVRRVDSMTVGATKVHVVDTLILQYFRRAHLRLGQFTNQQGQTEIFAQAQNLNPATVAYNTAAHTIKIPLTNMDSTDLPNETGWRSRTMVQPVPANIGGLMPHAGTNFMNLFGMNITFKSMLTPAFGDTMEARNGATVANPLNYFGHQLITNDGTKVIQAESYNNAWFTTSEQRYGQPMNGWNGNVPGNAYFTHRYWRGFVHATVRGLGSVDGVNTNGYGMGKAYPNPSTGSFSVDFALGQPQEVTITVTDLLGKVVAQKTDLQFGSGENTATINLEGVKPGVYVYTLRAGDYSASNKLTVQ
jgi:hypothetical protein